MSANERRKAIFEALCIRRYDTRENLASEFGVSVRTIAYDIVALSLNYPIYTTEGNGGGIHVEENYHLCCKSYLSDKQVELLEKVFPTLSDEDQKTMKSILTTFKQHFS